MTLSVEDWLLVIVLGVAVSDAVSGTCVTVTSTAGVVRADCAEGREESVT